MASRPSLSDLTADQLMQRARECRAMAATASTAETTDALIRLAERFEQLVVQREQIGTCD
jgi:hypothetical protein